MRKRKLIVTACAGLLFFAIGSGAFLWYQMRHFQIHFTDEELSDTTVAIKGLAGKAMFAGHPADLSGDSEGLIEAYKRDPEEFKRYARMYDTVMNAKRVGDAVLGQPANRLPRDSSKISMDSRARVDSWGNAFCIVPLDGKFAIVSRGPQGISCNALPLIRQQMQESQRSVFSGPSDVIVVIVAGNHTFSQPGA